MEVNHGAPRWESNLVSLTLKNKGPFYSFLFWFLVPSLISEVCTVDDCGPEESTEGIGSSSHQALTSNSSLFSGFDIRMNSECFCVVLTQI